MHTTPYTLLERLQRPDQPQAWPRFVELYSPLLLYWARRHALETHDAQDLVQEVLMLLVQTLPAFTYKRDGSFRAWLRTVMLNKLRDRARRRKLPMAAAGGKLSALADSDDGEPTEKEYRQYLVRRALEIMEKEFEPTTCKAFRGFVIDGRPAAQVAVELGISENAVYIAKCRVLRCLRKELKGLWD